MTRRAALPVRLTALERWPARRMSEAAALAADLVDAELTKHAIARRRAQRVDGAWWFSSGFVFGAAAAAGAMLLAAHFGLPLLP